MSAAAVEAVRPGLRTALAPARSPATPPARRAGQPTTRASGLTRLGAEQRDAHEQPEHAAGRAGAPRAAPATPAKMPIASAASGGRGARRRPVLAECAAKRDGRERRALADRRDRRHAGGPARRQDAREHRDAGAERASTPMTVRVRDHRAGLGQVDAQGADQGDHALGDPDARDEPDQPRRARPITRPSRTHRALDLLARGAERPQRGELARALRDGDRQRVEDDERAHEQRDAAEAEQDQCGWSSCRR